MEWVLRRHPELTRRKPQQLQIVRARASTAEEIKHWFEECLGPVLDSLQLIGKPHRIFNVDESGFPLSWTPQSILTRRGQKTPQPQILHFSIRPTPPTLCRPQRGKAESRDYLRRSSRYPLRSISQWVDDHRDFCGLAKDALSTIPSSREVRPADIGWPFFPYKVRG